MSRIAVRLSGRPWPYRGPRGLLVLPARLDQADQAEERDLPAHQGRAVQVAEQGGLGRADPRGLPVQAALPAARVGVVRQDRQARADPQGQAAQMGLAVRAVQVERRVLPARAALLAHRVRVGDLAGHRVLLDLQVLQERMGGPAE